MLESDWFPVLPWALTGTQIIFPLLSLSFPSLLIGGIPVSLSEAIKRKVELEWGTEDDEYLDKVERNLEKALQEHPPDVVVYNAGTDILEGDRLGGLSISPQVRTDLRRQKRVCSADSAAAGQVGHTGASSDIREG